jgi:hypothetical protein
MTSMTSPEHGTQQEFSWTGSSHRASLPRVALYAACSDARTASPDFGRTPSIWAMA